MVSTNHFFMTLLMPFTFRERIFMILHTSKLKRCLLNLTQYVFQFALCLLIESTTQFQLICSLERGYSSCKIGAIKTIWSSLKIAKFLQLVLQ